jgi:spore maturation protein CgeB
MVFGLLHEQQPLKKWSAFRQAGGHILKRQDFRNGTNVLKRAFVKTDYQRNIEVIKSLYQRPVFGLDMYRTLAASRITLNIHIDVAGNCAGNMRMFEATGVGACLLTEQSENINELFQPGKEILTYRSNEELLEIIHDMFNRKEEIEQIAKAGQNRTLQHHTLERMFTDIKPAFDI